MTNPVKEFMETSALSGESVCGTEGLKRAGGYLIAVGIGAASGAALMYFFDPNRGKARRTQFRDQTTSAWRRWEDRIEKRIEDCENRIDGVKAAWRQWIANAEPVGDEKLEARVKSRIGHWTRHAHAITVQVKEGIVSLGGAVLVDEVDAILKAVKAIPFVKGVENRMAMAATEEVLAASLAR